MEHLLHKIRFDIKWSEIIFIWLAQLYTFWNFHYDLKFIFSELV